MLIGINLLYLIPGKVGGTETYARELISAMQKVISHDDQLILFCSSDNSSTFTASSNTRLITLPINASNRVLRLLAEQTLLPLVCITHKIDVLFSLGYSAPLIHHCPSIVTIHDLNWHYHPEDFSPLQRLVWKYLTIWSARFSQHVITDSTFSRDSILKVLELHPSKVTSILHATPTKVKPSNPKISNPYLFTVLANYPHKNLKTLLTAFDQILELSPELQLVVCGLGKQANSSNNIKYLGYVSRSELASLYANCLAFIFPSAYEGFGYPVLEAMSYGAPVISSNAASLAEVVGDGGILVDPYDTKAYISAITKLLTSSKTRTEMSKRGYYRVSELRWNNTAKETFKIISKLERGK